MSCRPTTSQGEAHLAEVGGHRIEDVRGDVEGEQVGARDGHLVAHRGVSDVRHHMTMPATEVRTPVGEPLSESAGTLGAGGVRGPRRGKPGEGHRPEPVDHALELDVRGCLTHISV